MSGKSIDKLISQFPQGENRKQIIEWLLEVFKLWEQGGNQEVTEKRHQIAGRVYQAHERIESPSASDENERAAEWLVNYAIQTLTSPYPGIWESDSSFFIESAKGWLRQSK